MLIWDVFLPLGKSEWSRSEHGHAGVVCDVKVESNVKMW